MLMTRDPLQSRVDVLGIPVAPIDLQLAVGQFADWIRNRERHYVCVTGVHGVVESLDDRSLAQIHRRAGLVVPDGMPLVWLSRRAGFRRCGRVYGPSLLEAACSASQRGQWSHYFYGGAPRVTPRLIERLRRRFPDLAVAGWESPPFRPPTPAEDRDTTDRINASGADIVWVGLGTPKQERWMASRRPRLTPPILVGVGAAFDFLAGLKPQAPKWMQRNGLEWLFRTLTEPRRLGPRYLRSNPRFVSRVLPRLVQPHWPGVEPSCQRRNSSELSRGS